MIFITENIFINLGLIGICSLVTGIVCLVFGLIGGALLQDLDNRQYRVEYKRLKRILEEHDISPYKRGRR